MLSVIVPTFNESENIKTIIHKISESMKAAKVTYDYEILVVDDNSPDGTAKLAAELRKEYPVRVLLRRNKKGLSSAVIDGFAHAKGDILCVIDADLSHPPALIPKLVSQLDNYDIAVGSRLIKGGGAEEWPWHRRFISWSAQLLARPLTSVRDAMSGFFAVKKEVIKPVKLEAYGYKILLEVLVLGKYTRATEVPFIFMNRTHGQSKISLKVEIAYLKQLVHLYKKKFF